METIKNITAGMFMEMIYIDDNGNVRSTGVGAMMESDVATTAAFESVRASEVDIKDAKFILDLCEDNGDIVDSIAITTSTFTQVTGNAVRSDTEYIDYDETLCRKAKRR